MKKIFAIAVVIVFVVSACRPTKKIQTAIIKKDTAVVTDNGRVDSIRLIKDAYNGMLAHHIDFTTFSAKVDVDYIDAADKKYDVNANLRMYRDSAIWVSINAVFGIEGL